MSVPKKAISIIGVVSVENLSTIGLSASSGKEFFILSIASLTSAVATAKSVPQLNSINTLDLPSSEVELIVLIPLTVATAFSIILVSFQGDRTVLAHRGANSLININDINFDLIKKARLLYIAPLNGESNKVLEPLVKFAHEHGVKVCFNAGTTSLKKGFEEIKKLLEVANIVVMNREEASMCSGIVVRPDTKTEKFSQELIHPDVKKMLEKLKVQEYQVIVITDGSKGAYAFDGMKYYYCPTYPSPVVSTLGAGDAFASTFCAALGRTKLNIGKALMYASVNSAAVVSVFGASEGFLNFEQIEAKLGASPDYTYLLA